MLHTTLERGYSTTATECGAQVEDMLKRSFAEAHAQKALPEQQKLLRSGEEALRELASTKPIS